MREEEREISNCMKLKLFTQVLKYMKAKSSEAERERQRELEREKGSVLLVLKGHTGNTVLLILFRATEAGGRGEKAKSSRGKEAEGRAEAATEGGVRQTAGREGSAGREGERRGTN